MGRNFYSVCHECKVKLFHFRGREGDYMQVFQSVHSDHEKMTEIYNDYVEEPPESYFEIDNPDPDPADVRAKLRGSDLLATDSPSQVGSHSDAPSTRPTNKRTGDT